MANFLQTLIRNEKKLAKGSIIIIFLALIRCISEFYRLEYIEGETLSIMQIKPFVTGALITAVALLVMVVLYFYSKFKWIVCFAVTAIVLLFVVKFAYGLA